MSRRWSRLLVLSGRERNQPSMFAVTHSLATDAGSSFGTDTLVLRSMRVAVSGLADTALSAVTGPPRSTDSNPVKVSPSSVCSPGMPSGRVGNSGGPPSTYAGASGASGAVGRGR